MLTLEMIVPREWELFPSQGKDGDKQHPWHLVSIVDGLL